MESGRVLAFSGGIGGAKLALGLQRVLESGMLLVAANTGDDFEHLGLSISPDIDTLLYTLAGLDNPEVGWGRRDETWNFMAALETLEGETWFRLGDRDLALHVERTRRLRKGESLSEITADVARALRVPSKVVPMSDDSVRTRVETDEGWLDFQEYFVHRQCRPVISAIVFEGAATARANPDVIAALADPHLRAVIVCPSNPFISIEPILAVSGMREALEGCAAPVVAVSPIIGGASIKGPTSKMMHELGIECSAAAVAMRYGSLLDAFVIDEIDANICADLQLPLVVAKGLMTTIADRECLAMAALEAADRVAATR